MNVKIIKSRRKTISLSVDDDLNAVLKAPYFVSDDEVNAFLNKNRAWLENAAERKKAALEKYDITDEERKALIDKAQKYLPERIKYYSELTRLYPTGVKITGAKKRFGSCSGKNSICFSYYLMMYPDEAVDYVVLHELAHIKHHKHRGVEPHTVSVG